jgi:signal peptidase I
MPEDERADFSSSKTEVISTPLPGAPSTDGEGDASEPGPDAAATTTVTTTEPPPGDAEPKSDAPAPEVKKTSQKKEPSLLSKLTELPILLVLAFAIAVVIKMFLVQAFFIPSGSMIPTLQVGDRVLVEKLSYRWGSPSQGDIVVFAKDVFSGNGDEPDYAWYDRARIFFRELIGLPTGTQEDYIKRIVAVGGDSIRYAGSPRKLLVNGKEVDEPYIKGGRDNGSPSLTGSDCKRLDMEKAGRGCRVPAGFVFVMGDNRGNSEDSRILGPVDEDKIVGNAFLILWPPSGFGTI